ncbi:SDR family oxidoreductase [Niveispirillum sp. KHB5.9]|uniref:SDR family oxidoreductase n=1 Tax=Niveispirillum sp. KHB5.9 TaxID=3400269 RepID=UPI003A871B51
MARPLEGRIALVTGASRGIGSAIAERLARDGADVAVHYGSHRQSAEDLAERCRTDHGVRGQAFQADLADLSDAGGAVALFAAVTAALGVPDIVVNNAGTGRFAPIQEIKAQELAQVLAVNAATPLLLAREAAKAMKPGGRIINIGSVITDMPVGQRAVYAASKGAVHAMTGVLAQELGPLGININTVAPGVTATDRFKSGDRSREGEITSRTALRRIGEPEDIAAVVAWLAGPDAAWITGEVIRASGGLRGL